MARKKSKAQKTFERERAEVSQIILDRGETLPGIGVIDEAWLQRWKANEARKVEVKQILIDRCEPLPEGGITDTWLHTWETIEATRILQEQGKAPPADDMTPDWLLRFKADQKAAEAEVRPRTAKRKADSDAEQARKEELRAEKEHSKRVKLAEAESLMRLAIPEEAEEETEDNSDANPRAFTDDDDWMMVDDDDNDDAINAIQSTFEETNTSQDTEETEMQQSSVDNSAKKKRYYPRLLGFKRKGNARKNAAKLQAMNALPGHESEIFEETGVHLKDEDQILGEEEKKATVENMPPKYRMDSDPRLGELEVDTTSHIQEGERHDRFVETARKIVSFLKSSASTYRNLPREAKKTTWKPMVSGLLTLMCRASEDFLLENLLSGIDNSVRFTLGNLDFTLDDLVNLPRWSVTKNLEKGVYVDILHIKEELEQIRQLYVGSATGKFGIAQRWYQYLQRRVKHESGRHSKAILKPNSTVCLRGLAQYDDTRYPWLVCFAETFFMVYLGTVTDPGWRPTTGDIREAFINDELYELVGACRRAAGLPAPLSVGLNSTWSLCQGYRGGLNINSACFNCERKVVPRTHPDWEPEAFISRDPERPGENVECYNCVIYRRKYGVNRNPSAEKRLAFRRTMPVPKVCQAWKCKHKLIPYGEMIDFYLKNYKYGGSRVNQCPSTGRWVAKVFQHDEIHLGKYYWVCNDCSRFQMGWKFYFDNRKKLSGKPEVASPTPQQ